MRVISDRLHEITRLNGGRIGTPSLACCLLLCSRRAHHKTIGPLVIQCHAVDAIGERCQSFVSLVSSRITVSCKVCTRRTTSCRHNAAERYPTVLSAHYSGCIAPCDRSAVFDARLSDFHAHNLSKSAPQPYISSHSIRRGRLHDSW